MDHWRWITKTLTTREWRSTAAVVVLLALVLLVLGSWVENNESRLMGVPKSDYMQVLTNILSAGPPLAKTTASAARHPAVVRQLPRAEAGSDSEIDEQDGEEVKLLAGKRDSFYFLIQSMRARASLAERSSPVSGAGRGGGERVADLGAHGLGHAREHRPLADPHVEAHGPVRGQRRDRRADW